MSVDRLMARRQVVAAGWVTPCWMWTGSTFAGKEYGQIKHEGKNWRVHRLAYELLVGPIPSGLVVDHLCRQPRCFRPDHLEAVTSVVNTHRGEGPSAINARRATCSHGHLLAGENLYLTPDGRRKCRVCLRNANAKYEVKRPWDRGDREKARAAARERTRRYRARLAAKIDVMLAH